MTDETKDIVLSTWRSAQTSVIGSMLIAPSCVPEVLAGTDSSDFDGFSLAAYNAIRRLSLEGRSIDPVIVLDAMGPEYRAQIVETMRETPTSAHVGEYVKILRDHSRLNALRHLSYELSGVSEMDTARDLVAKAQSYTVERRGLSVRSWAQMIDSFMESHKDNKAQSFLDWGFDALNNILHVTGGKYVLLGGEPSSGKSALMLQMAMHMSRKYKVGLFSLETDEQELTGRLLAHRSQTGLRNIMRNDLRLDDWNRINRTFADTYSQQLETIDAAGMTAEDICATTLARGYDVIFIDYVQLVVPSGSGREIREQQVARISRQLQLLAKRNGVVVIGLSQLSRPDTDRDGNSKEPGMHSFRESGQLEQDADVAMILYKTTPKDPKSSRKLFICKNKTGELGRMTLRFDGAKQTFIYEPPGSRLHEVQHLSDLQPESADNPWKQSELPM